MKVTRITPNRAFFPLKSKTEKENAHSDVTKIPKKTVDSVTKKLLNIALPKFLWIKISLNAPRKNWLSNQRALPLKGIRSAKIALSVLKDDTNTHHIGSKKIMEKNTKTIYFNAFIIIFLEGMILLLGLDENELKEHDKKNYQ